MGETAGGGGMNLKQAHKRIEHDRIKREIINIVERRLVYDVTIGMKAVFLLALKKEGWGKQRAIRLFEEVEKIEQGLYDGESNSFGGIEWQDVFEQVKNEYGIELGFTELVKEV